MRPTVSVLVGLVILLGGCERRGPSAPEAVAPSASASPTVAATGASPVAAASWDLASSGEGTALVFPGEGLTAIRLFCPAVGKRLLVNVPGFRAIASEERLSLGSGGAAEALVADPRGDRQRGGVSAAGTVPANLASLVAGPVTAVYGAQTSGPHPAPPPGLARAFVLSCNAAGPAAAGTPAAGGSPCQVQDGEPVIVRPLRAVGTEPFWGARIDGRCVTYSHPEDQRGTRVWTRYTPSASGGTWTGALGGTPFKLQTRTQAGCSDGMSDKRYPIAVTLLVGGERRTGCAEPL